jgi:hypothetical protein
MKAVPSEKPFKLALALLVKPDPVIVTVTVGLPAGAEDGLTDVIVGPAEAGEIMKGTLLDAGPVAFATVICAVP